MSRWLHWLNNRKQKFNLLYTIQRTAMERLDSITRRLCKECNKSNEHEQSSKPSKSVKRTKRTATCTRAFGRASPRYGRASTRASSTTTFSGASTTTNRECANDILQRDYNEYLASTSASRKDVSARLRSSDELRNFKQADADSTGSVERRTGIPAGVTI